MNKDNNIYHLGNSVKPFKPRAIAMPDQIGEQCQKYLQRLAVMNMSKNTIAAYKTDLEQFVGYLQSNRVHYITGATQRVVQDFILYCLQVKGVSARTVARKYESIKGFFNFALREQWILATPCIDVELPKYVPKKVIAPELEEITAFLDSIPTRTPMEIRDRTFFEIMFFGAYRISSLIGLNVYDPNAAIDTISPHGRVIATIKGGGTDEKELSHSALEWINKWLAVRSTMAKANEVALFVSNRGGRVSRNTMYARLKKYARGFDLPALHPHMLRHRRGGQILDELGVRAAQSYLTHKSPTTTIEVYGCHSAKKTREMLSQHCPLPGRD